MTVLSMESWQSKVTKAEPLCFLLSLSIMSSITLTPPPMFKIISQVFISVFLNADNRDLFQLVTPRQPGFWESPDTALFGSTTLTITSCSFALIDSSAPADWYTRQIQSPWSIWCLDVSSPHSWWEVVPIAQNAPQTHHRVFWNSAAELTSIDEITWLLELLKSETPVDLKAGK